GAVPLPAPPHVRGAGADRDRRPAGPRLPVGDVARAPRHRDPGPARCAGGRGARADVSRARPLGGAREAAHPLRLLTRSWDGEDCGPDRTSLTILPSRMHTVAVDILTGFLGSGKTTLLRHVLDHGLRGKPVAVIMNEIGDIGIDGRVV